MKEFVDTLLPLCLVEGDHRALWEAVWTAQRLSAKAYPSMSKMLVNLVGQSSGSFIHALTAGLTSVGEKHGPIAKARDDFLYYTEAQVTKEAVQRGIKIYGFGHSFYKRQTDPYWLQVHDILRTHYAQTFEGIRQIQKGLQEAGKNIYPNPAGYSAAAANATGLLRGMEEIIFVLPRMQIWLEEYVITQTVKAGG